MENLSFKGFGIGLRTAHYQQILAERPNIDWFEIISEDFMVEGGSPLYYLDKIREDYPLAMHGVSLSIGSADPLDEEYLNRLKALVDRIDPLWVSDHLCWTGVNGVNMHDLMPLPHTEEAIQHVVQRVKKVQDFLGRHLLLENISSYVTYHASEMTEWDFLSEVARRADCLILLDINNIFVNAFNHGFDVLDFLNGVSKERVQQFHIAGHKNCKTHIIDTHDNTIIQDVWDLYAQGIKRFDVATLIERDANIPALSDLLDELEIAKQINQEVMCEQVA